MCDLFNRLFVGAPRGNYTNPTRKQLRYIVEPGVVYRCALPGPCVEIEPSVVEDEYVPIYMLRGRVMKEHSWFGGAMSIERSAGFLTVYAHFTKNIRNVRYRIGSIQRILHCRYAHLGRLQILLNIAAKRRTLCTACATTVERSGTQRWTRINPTSKIIVHIVS